MVDWSTHIECKYFLPRNTYSFLLVYIYESVDMYDSMLVYIYRCIAVSLNRIVNTSDLATGSMIRSLIPLQQDEQHNVLHLCHKIWHLSMAIMCVGSGWGWWERYYVWIWLDVFVLVILFSFFGGVVAFRFRSAQNEFRLWCATSSNIKECLRICESVSTCALVSAPGKWGVVPGRGSLTEPWCGSDKCGVWIFFGVAVMCECSITRILIWHE